MHDILSLNQAIELALNEADYKFKANKLFKAGDDSPAANDFTDEDPETIYSITTMYEQFVEEVSEEKAHIKIIEALSKKYPEYV